MREAVGSTDRSVEDREEVVLTQDQVHKLLAYRALLLRWNRVHNLTALRTPDEALTHHLFDCLAVVPPLLRHVAGLAWHADGADAEQAPGTAARALRPAQEIDQAIADEIKGMVFVLLQA